MGKRTTRSISVGLLTNKLNEMADLRIEPKEKAKQVVNRIYQPMGYLGSNKSSDEMWEWAKLRAKEQLKELIEEIPMYQGNLNPKWKYWNNVIGELNELP